MRGARPEASNKRKAKEEAGRKGELCWEGRQVQVSYPEELENAMRG